MEQPQSSKWYYGILTVLIALITLGPFAYPLLWKSPKFNRASKIILTVVFTALTIYLIFASWQLYGFLIQQLQGISTSEI